MLLVGADRDVPPVACLVDGIAGKVSGELRLPALGWAPREQVEQRVVDVPRDGAVEHGDVDQLAAAGALTGDERRQDADRRHEGARADVGDLHARDDRRPARLADVVEHACGRQVVDVVADAVAVRAVLAVAGDRTVDEPRVQRRQTLAADPEARHDARPEALEHHVRVRRQPEEDLTPCLGLQVEGHAALVAGEERDAGRERIVRPRDHEDVGAEIGEQRRAERARQLAREVEDAEVTERRHARAGTRRITTTGRRVTQRRSAASVLLKRDAPMAQSSVT